MKTLTQENTQWAFLKSCFLGITLNVKNSLALFFLLFISFSTTLAQQSGKTGKSLITGKSPSWASVYPVKNVVQQQYQKYVTEKGIIYNEAGYQVTPAALPLLAGAGTPCTAHRWFDGDGWRNNAATSNQWEPVVLNSPNLQPKGIVRCASSAETESGLEAFKGTYVIGDNPISAVLPQSDCFSMTTETFGNNLSAPTAGEDILWFNFDIRPLAGTYQFQIVTNENVGWVLFHVDPAKAGPIDGVDGGSSYPGASGLSGDCSDLEFATIDIGGVSHPACGFSGNGWTTITVPSFKKPTNYYLAMWMADAGTTEFPNSMNLVYKSRYGCGGATCTLEFANKSVVCNNDGTYTVCLNYGGSAGRWTIKDETGLASSVSYTTYLQDETTVVTTGSNPPTNPLLMTLGVIPDGAVFAKVCATYPIGTPYDISLTPDPTFSLGQDYIQCADGNRQTGASATTATVTATVSPSCSPPVAGEGCIDITSASHSATLSVASVTPGVISDYNYLWTIFGTGNGTLQNATTATATYVAGILDAGQDVVFVVTATPKDDSVCITTDTVLVHVSSIGRCSVTGPESVCAGSTNLYTGAPNPVPANATYLWTLTGYGGVGTTNAALSGTNGLATINVIAGTQDYRITLNQTYANADLSAECFVDVRVNAITASDASTNVSCNGETNGSVTITFSGGTAPYEVNFNGGGFAAQTSPAVYNNLAAGTYTWVVRDASGCSQTGSETITQPAALIAEDAHNNVSCNGGSNGSVTITFSGGTAPYQVNFNGGGFATQTSPAVYNNLGAATYTWVVMDANGCTQSGSEEVTQPPALIATDGHTDVSCNGGSNGSVTITFSGGTPPYQVNFNGGGFAAQTSPAVYTGLAAATYTWVVMDANGCTQTGSETVTQPPTLVANDAHTDATCNGAGDGSVTITFSGGTAPYEVNFNGGGFATQTSPAVYDNLAAGTYTWVVRDANGCTQTGSETVGSPSTITASDAHTDVSCNGGSNGSVTITFSGGTAPYEVNFNGGGFATQTSPAVYNNLAAATYTWVVRDANGCQQSGSETVEQPTALVATDDHNDVSCNGGSNGSITITFNGGTAPYQVSFNGGGFATQTSPAVYNNLAAATYTWVVRDANGCTQSGSETVGQPDALVANDDNTDVSCNGGSDGSVTITFSGGTPPYQVNFNGGGFATQTSPAVYNGLAAATYTWVVMDANGCTQTGSETVGQPAALVATDDHTDATCNGGATGSVTITFSGGTAPYEVNFNGGGFATQTSPAVYDNLAAGTYTWVVRDANGCTQTGSETVGTPSAIIATDAHTDVSCNGGSDGTVTITFSGGTAPYQVNFNGGGFVTQTSPVEYTGLAAGTYTWVVRDASGCDQPGSETVGQPAALVASDAHTDVSCNGGSTGSVTITFSGGTPPYQVNFNGGGFVTQTSPAVYTGLAAATYTWVVRDANGCTQTGSETVDQPGVLEINCRILAIVICGVINSGAIDVDVTGGTAPFTFDWDDLAGTLDPEDRTGLIPGTYRITVTDARGCSISCIRTLLAPVCNDKVCTYTQGAYGNPGGNHCNGDGTTSTSLEQINNALENVGGSYVFGSTSTNRYWTIVQADAEHIMNEMLPGGGRAQIFAQRIGGGTWSQQSSWYVAPLQLGGRNSGKINNTLFAQTLTLFLNLNFDATNGAALGAIPLSDSMITRASSTCGEDGIPTGEPDTFGIPHSVIVYLNSSAVDPYPTTVAGLFKLANDVLGGVVTDVDIEDVATAVDVINNAFDGCRFLVGTVPFLEPTPNTFTRATPGLTKETSLAVDNAVAVKAYPNPFTDKIVFTINSRLAGAASFDLYNLLGEKVTNLYQGYMEQNGVKTLTYNVPEARRQTMIYQFRVGNKMVTGKVVNPR